MTRRSTRPFSSGASATPSPAASPEACPRSAASPGARRTACPAWSWIATPPCSWSSAGRSGWRGGGARRAVLIESSPEALAGARRNLELNGVAERAEIVAANAFDELRRLERAGARFGLVVLDPPPFARSRTQLEAAVRGYKEINLRAMRLLERGRSEEHTSELQSHSDLVCRLLLEKKTHRPSSSRPLTEWSRTRR